MRASFYVLGPFLSRYNYAEVSLPGGCAWGPRPVDYHIKAFKKLGAKVELNSGYIIAKGQLTGCEINFKNIFVSKEIIRACSSVVECYVDIVEVASSILAVPTKS